LLCGCVAAVLLLVGAHAIDAESQTLTAELAAEGIGESWLTREISKAKGNLQGMMLAEVDEVKEMGDVLTTGTLHGAVGASGEDQRQLRDFAKNAIRQEKLAEGNEDGQQKLAVESMEEIDAAIAKVQSVKKGALGESTSAKASRWTTDSSGLNVWVNDDANSESAASSKSTEGWSKNKAGHDIWVDDTSSKSAASNNVMDDVAQKLQHVSAELHEGTKTMNTKKRLQRMEHESVVLQSEAASMLPGNTLGEAADAAEAEEGALALLSAPATGAAPKADGTPRANQGALSLLSATAPATSTAPKADDTARADEGALALLSATAPATSTAPKADDTARADEGALALLSHPGSNTASQSESAASSEVQNEEGKVLDKLLQQDKTVADTEKKVQNYIQGLIHDLA